MNDMSSTPKAAPAVVWDRPVIHDIPGALEVSAFRLERVRTLVASNVEDVDALLFEHGELPPALKSWAEAVMMIFTIADEKLAELHEVIWAINDRARQQSRNGMRRHVEMARHTAWNMAVHRLEALHSRAITRDSDERAATEASDALKDLIDTRVASPAQFREKLDIIRRADVFAHDGVIDSIFADLDALGWTSAAGREG